MQAAGEATESSKVSDLPFSGKPNYVGDARALLRACQKIVCSSSVSSPHTTPSAANGTPSIEKWSSMMHVSHSTHNTSRPFFNTWELNVLSKYRLARRVVQSYAGPGAPQGWEAGEVEILQWLMGCWEDRQWPGGVCSYVSSFPSPWASLVGKSKGKMTEGELCYLPVSALFWWALRESPGKSYFAALQENP